MIPDQDWGNKGSHQYRYLIRHLPDADFTCSVIRMMYGSLPRWSGPCFIWSSIRQRSWVIYVHNYYVCDGDLHIEHTLPDRPSVSPEEMRQVNLAKVIMSKLWAAWVWRRDLTVS